MVLEAREYFSILKEQVEQGKEASMIITGNSMAPFLLHSRDTVYFRKPFRKLRRGDIVFFIRESGQYVLHRYYKKDKKGYYFIGDNQTELEGPLSENCVFAVVTRVKRNGRLLDSKSLLWLFFSKIWINMIPIRRITISVYRKLHAKAY